MSQAEFGFSGIGGKIKLPCDATAMEYVMCLLRREAYEEVERAFLSSMAIEALPPWKWLDAAHGICCSLLLKISTELLELVVVLCPPCFHFFQDVKM
jgi:hypothetical protein